MSSPIANNSKNFVQQLMVKSHQKLAHNQRINYLAHLFIQLVDKLNLANKKVIDIGCGDMTLATSLQKQWVGCSMHCVDTYPLPSDLKESSTWEKYTAYDGLVLPFENQSMDIALLCDVLHHDFEQATQLLNEALRVSKVVLLKDHFEYGFVSRQTLRLMDFVGNWGYGVSIPKRYYSLSSFEQQLEQLSYAEEIKRICPIPLYEHHFLFRHLCPAKLQFVSVLKSSYQNTSYE